MGAAGDEAGEMGHVHQQPGPDPVGDAAELGEIENAGIGGPAGDDQLGSIFIGQLLHLRHVDAVVVRPHAIGDAAEPLARLVHGRAVGEVAASGQTQAENGVTGLQQGQIDGLIGLAAGMGLHVGVGAAEEALGPGDGQGFHTIHRAAAAVIAPTRVAFRVLVGEHRALHFQHGAADDVLRGDQFDRMPLPRIFGSHVAGRFGVDAAQRSGGLVVWRPGQIIWVVHLSLPFSVADGRGAGSPGAIAGSRPA